MLIVVSINDPRATEFAVKKLRQASPMTPIMARAQYEMDWDSLQSAGATGIITAESTARGALVEASLAELSESAEDPRPAG